MADEKNDLNINLENGLVTSIIQKVTFKLFTFLPQLKNNNMIFLVTGNSSSFDLSMADEKNDLNIDLENGLVTSINPKGNI